MSQERAFRIETPLAERLAGIRARIRAAAERSGRSAEVVRLIGASKTVAAERLVEVVRAGLSDLGENRVQEAEAKVPAVRAVIEQSPAWHLIGHLQSNKARRALALFDWVHSIDSPGLADALDRIAGELGLRPRVLVEVNVGEESAKAGVAPPDAPALVAHVAGLPHLVLAGLMTVGPLVATAEEARPAFRRVRALLEESRRGLSAGAAERLVELSMGMSADYEVAIEEGSTMVRVGSALFGSRPA